jgi:catechol 2,3-dioxygenase-like lactoylglutathione lyase family enzyme
MHSQPLIAVKDVEASSRWYQRLLACESGHGGSEYERLIFGGELVLQLHRWDAHVHPHMGDAQSKSRGNGVLLWFQTDEFDPAVERARGLKVEFLEQPHVNPNAGHRECWIRDPDGYVVVLASACGDVGAGTTS